MCYQPIFNIQFEVNWVGFRISCFKWHFQLLEIYFRHVKSKYRCDLQLFNCNTLHVFKYSRMSILVLYYLKTMLTCLTPLSVIFKLFHDSTRNILPS